MKKLFTLMLAVLMVAALAVSVSADGTGATYTAPYGVATIDGVIDAAWDEAAWEEIVNNRVEGEKMTVRFKVMHDGTNVYFLAEANDPAISATKLNECLWFVLHSHACSAPDGCGTITKDFMQVNGNIWDDIAKESTPAADNENFKVVKNGSVYTMEWKITADAPITTDTVFGLDFLVDDYDANAGWISNQQYWNTASSKDMVNPANMGSLYFLAAPEGGDVTPPPAEDDTTPPADSDNTPADTTKPVETPTTDKVPTTADAGLAIAAVVMAAAAMVVLSKKH